MRIDHWCIIARSSPWLQPPEHERFCLHGVVRGHYRCADGKEVTTSTIVSRRGDRVVTKSGSEYELGPADPMYEALYPNARERMLANLHSYEPTEHLVYQI